MNMNYKTLLLISASAFGFAACSQQTTPEISSPKVLGVLKVQFDSTIGTQATFQANKLSTQAVLNDNQIDVVSAGAAIRVSENNGPRAFDYVAKNFTVTNNTGATVNNLTLVALEQTGNLSGAIKSATNFGGGATDANAASQARPTHAMTASAGMVSVDNSTPARAGFQALTAAEATAIENDTNFAGQGLSGTVLEYGFVATNTAGTNRTIADGQSGNLTIAYRFPASATGTYNFVLTFAVTAEAANRVTRSPEETTANANTRATTLGATEKYFVDGADATAIAGYTRVGNVKISTTKNLLVNPGKLVIARIYNDAGASPATYTRKFAEIFNAGEFSVNLVGKSFQSGTGAANLGASNNDRLDLTSVLAPGQYRLLRFGATNGGPTPSPADQTAQNVALPSLDGGKAAIASVITNLDCAGLCTATTTILDGLGYLNRTGGTNTTYFEGTAAATTTTNTQSIVRKNRGCTDTNNNANDFEVDTLGLSNSARTSISPTFICP
jgi:hypothetical protein